MRSVLYLLLLSCSIIGYTQSASLSTGSKKAAKFYERGREAIRKRNFDEGISYYKKAVTKDPEFSEALLRLASAYSILRSLDSSYKYYDLYRRFTPNDQISERHAFFLSDLYFENGEYEKALEILKVGQKKSESWKTDAGKRKLVDNITFAIDNSEHRLDYVIELLPPEVNQFYTQYFPAVTIDGKSLFFTRRNGASQKDDEDLVVSRFENGEWTNAKSISKNINSPFNEGACTISADGRTIIFTSCEEKNSFGSCDLFIATKKGDNWSNPTNLGAMVNSPYWDSQPSLSADGRGLFFSSNRPGGYGQRDLWVTYYDEKGWSKPVNLGGKVNTESDETTPYIHSNNQALFFASTGHPGFGGYDLFISEVERDSIWGQPNNLGFGVNDHHDQLSLIISADGMTGFFALEKMDGDGYISSKVAKIYFKEDTLVDHRASYVTGRVLDAETGKPIGATIRLYDLAVNKIRYETESDPILGSYFFVLTEGNEYGAFVSSEGYLFEDFRFVVEDNTLLDPDTIDIRLKPIDKGLNLVLENIYFEFDSYELVSRSISELNNISDFLKQYDIKVEISGHTDEIGSDEYNKNLSVNRARAVYDYLISSGVDTQKLVYQGYGSSKPRFTLEEEKHKNRRIEFEILQVNRKN